MLSMLGSGSVSRRRPFASWYSVTPSSETTLRGASAATAQTAHSSKLTADSRFISKSRKPGAEKLFLLLPAFAVSLGAGFTFRRVLRLRAHLVAHAIAVRVALLARAGLVGLAVRRFHLRDALLATRGILRLRAVNALGEDAGTGREEQHADQGFEHENGPFVEEDCRTTPVLAAPLTGEL